MFVYVSFKFHPMESGTSKPFCRQNIFIGHILLNIYLNTIPTAQKGLMSKPQKSWSLYNPQSPAS